MPDVTQQAVAELGLNGDRSWVCLVLFWGVWGRKTKLFLTEHGVDGCFTQAVENTIYSFL